jgi:hypothetical protein
MVNKYSKYCVRDEGDRQQKGFARILTNLVRNDRLFATERSLFDMTDLSTNEVSCFIDWVFANTRLFVWSWIRGYIFLG